MLAIVGSASVVGVMVIIAVCTWMLRLPGVRVDDVRVSGAVSVPPETIIASVQGSLTGRYLWLVPRDNALFLREKGVAAAVRTLYPRLKDVEVRRLGLQTLAVTVSEREPAALWCGDIVPPIAYQPLDDEAMKSAVPEERWGTCYLMDEENFIFAVAPVYTGNVLPRYYGPLDKGEPIGQNFIAQDEFHRWASLRSSLSDVGYPAHAMLIVDERDVELYLVNGVRVLLNRDVTTERALRALAALGENKVFDGPALEYLDLRWDGKAYYKYVADSETSEFAEGSAEEESSDVEERAEVTENSGEE